MAETDEPIAHQCLCYVTSANSIRERLAGMTEGQFLKSQSRVARLIRRGLGMQEFLPAGVAA